MYILHLYEGHIFSSNSTDGWKQETKSVLHVSDFSYLWSGHSPSHRMYLFIVSCNMNFFWEIIYYINERGILGEIHLSHGRRPSINDDVVIQWRTREFVIDVTMVGMFMIDRQYHIHYLEGVILPWVWGMKTFL